MKKKFTLAGIGEVMFDVLPEQKKLGGAPVNFRLARASSLRRTRTSQSATARLQ